MLEITGYIVRYGCQRAIACSGKRQQKRSAGMPVHTRSVVCQRQVIARRKRECRAAARKSVCYAAPPHRRRMRGCSRGGAPENVRRKPPMKRATLSASALRVVATHTGQAKCHTTMPMYKMSAANDIETATCQRIRLKFCFSHAQCHAARCLYVLLSLLVIRPERRQTEYVLL